SVEDVSSMSVGFVHDKSITTCNSCHESQRPDTLVGPNFYNHADGAALTGDCVMCHDQPGGSWTSANAKFTHSPIPASCNNCHNTARPAPTSPNSLYATGKLYLHYA